jgi:hypothetical protein
VYRDQRHFVLELFSKRDPAEPRVHVVVYSQGRPTQRRPATRKHVVQRLYPYGERKGNNRRWSDAKAQMTPMKRLRRQMSKIGSGGVSSGREAAPPLMINRERRNNSGPFAASVRVKFMELRPNIGQWPIGHPKHIGTFRFCGSARSSRAIYCNAHNAKAHASNRPKMLGTTEFQAQPLVRVA